MDGTHAFRGQRATCLAGDNEQYVSIGQLRAKPRKHQCEGYHHTLQCGNKHANNG